MMSADVCTGLRFSTKRVTRRYCKVRNVGSRTKWLPERCRGHWHMTPNRAVKS